jgi:hypothetical protein
MRVLAGSALLVAVVAVAFAGFAVGDARRAAHDARAARAHAQALEARAAASRHQLARARLQLGRLAPTAGAVNALCRAARSASIPSDTYAVAVARSIVHGIVSSCDWGRVAYTP